jgi:YHS domain-containing protein
MVSFIIRILLLALAIYLIRRFMTAFLRKAGRPGTGNTAGRPANHMVKDPVCGMYLDSRLAVSLNKAGDVFYFCSEECKEKFLIQSPTDGSKADSNG